MSSTSKPRIFTEYKKLTPEIQGQLFTRYPYGFDKHLISFTRKKGKLVFALPFETEESYYLVKMSRNQAIKIVLTDREKYLTPQ